jgi:hypothetical protein
MAAADTPLPSVVFGTPGGLSRARIHDTVAVNIVAAVSKPHRDGLNGRKMALSFLRRSGRGTRNVLHTEFQGNVRSMSLAWGSTSHRKQNPTSALPSTSAPIIPPDQESFSNFCPHLFFSGGSSSFHVKLSRRETSRNIFISMPSKTPTKK